MSRKTEDALVKELAVQLKSKAAGIWTHKKPSTSSKFRKRINDCLGYIPILQPEIDLCIRSREGHLFAVEAKLFSGHELTYRTPFYEGIGQALALHRYGFDAVALWFMFPDGASTQGLNRYGAEAWAFVRNDLHLPLDFSYISAKRQDSRHVFAVMQYTGRQTGYEIEKPIDDPLFVLQWNHPNPIRCFPAQQALRETLDWWLETQPQSG